jgi:hypothetical protein
MRRTKGKKIHRQLSIIWGNGGEEGHGQPTTMVKTKAFKP